MNPGKDIFQFCPHCGARGFHPASAKKSVCGACGFNYYFNPVGAAAAIILDAQDRILLIRRAKEPAKGTYDLPGGFIDFHETIESGLRREIREEVGLEVDMLDYLCSFPNIYHYGGMVYHTIDAIFVCRARDTAVKQDTGEVSDFDFLPPREIDLNHIGMASIRKGVEFYLHEKGKTP